MLLAAAILGLSLANHQIGLPTIADEAKPIQYTWVFFRSGTRSREYTKEELDKMQADHVGNLGRLGNAKLCPLAGPTGNAGDIRGIVVLTPRTEDQLKEDFKPDPFVQGGLLKVDAFPVTSIPGLLYTMDEPFAMDQQTIVFLKLAEGKKLAGLDARGHREYLSDLWKARKLGFYATVPNPEDILAILILPVKTDDEAKAIADKDPLVKSGNLVWESHPQYFAKGVVRVKPIE